MLDEQNTPYEFKVELDQKIFVFVIPNENDPNTSIEFEYYGEGEPYEWYIFWYYKYFTGNEEKE